VFEEQPPPPEKSNPQKWLEYFFHEK
jgi:hypothetical protein